jgi:hypothetical protein
MSSFRAVLIPVALGTIVFAQRGPATPPARAHHALVYDESRGTVLLAGGSSPYPGGQCCASFNDLWSFDGVRWTALAASGTPMSGMRLAFDAASQRVISFGGFANGQSRGDVRVLDGNAWKDLGRHPSVVTAESGFVYDTGRKRFVAFGGLGGSAPAQGETWEFDGAKWTKAAGANPPDRHMHAMVWDARRSRIVLFGGVGTGADGKPVVLGDLWEHDGRAWTEVKGLPGPGPRAEMGFAFDAKRGRTVLFGGDGPKGSRGDTWAWNGTAWRKLADTGPEPRGMGHLAYDKKRDRIVLFGGRKAWPTDLADTWEWDGTKWTRVGS